MHAGSAKQGLTASQQTAARHPLQSLPFESMLHWAASAGSKPPAPVEPPVLRAPPEDEPPAFPPVLGVLDPIGASPSLEHAK